MNWTPESIAAHVGAPNLHEAFDVMLRTKADDENKIASMFAKIKELAAALASAQADTRRLDWLEKKFGLWNQGIVLSIGNDGFMSHWECNSGFHHGKTARAAIDAAIDAALAPGEVTL